MRRPILLLSGVLLVGACGETPTAPGPVSSAPTGLAAQAREQGISVTCVAVNTPGAYSATVSWARVKVLNVSITTENGTITTPLARPKRKGTVNFAPTSETLGFRIDDGVQTIAQGGCSPA